LKSNASDYLELAQEIYRDACALCPADVSDLRDIKTILSRVKHEGISFLTISLPRFAKGLEMALAQGGFDPTWRKTELRGFPFHGASPVFLRGMLDLMFDRETGRIYDEQDSTYVVYYPIIIDCIRQICLAFKKVELDCTEQRVQAAYDNFVDIERSFDSLKATDEDIAEFRRVSSVLWDNLIYHLYDNEPTLTHGPGATAERISGNQKFRWRYWFKRLDNYFPLFDHAYSSSAIDSEEVKLVTLVNPEDEFPVRVTPVPKTLKGPRIIAIEPSCMQYAQQGIRSILYKGIEAYWLTSGHVNFRDQTINQRLAISGSTEGQLATIDLSDASDRVPLELVSIMFRANPHLWESIEACRSTRAILPDGRYIGPLRKFASMGSALCFPIESMYFYTLCVAALLRLHKLPVTQRGCYLASRQIYVYGDDIVVPTYAAGTVLEYLQKYNCKVNTSKTFYTGMFRESCGVDAYRGVPVIPVYLRKTRPRNRRHAAELVSWSQTANQFFRKGYVRTAEHMHSICASILRIYPRVDETSSALGRNYDLAFVIPRKRYNKRYQRLEIQAWVTSPVYRTDRLEGYAALQKTLLMAEGRSHVPPHSRGSLRSYALQVLEQPDVDNLHLERSALHGAVALKLRWVTPT